MSTLSAETETKPIPEEWRRFAEAVTDDSTKSFRDALRKVGHCYQWFAKQQEDKDFRVFMSDFIGKRALFRRLQCEFLWNEVIGEKKIDGRRMAQLKYFLGRWDPGQIETQEIQALVNVNPADVNSTRVAVALLLKRANRWPGHDDESEIIPAEEF